MRKENRMTVSFNDRIYDELKKDAENKGISLSSVVSIAVSEYFKSKKLTDMLPDMIEVLNKAKTFEELGEFALENENLRRQFEEEEKAEN